MILCNPRSSGHHLKPCRVLKYRFFLYQSHSCPYFLILPHLSRYNAYHEYTFRLSGGCWSLHEAARGGKQAWCHHPRHVSWQPNGSGTCLTGAGKEKAAILSLFLSVFGEKRIPDPFDNQHRDGIWFHHVISLRLLACDFTAIVLLCLWALWTHLVFDLGPFSSNMFRIIEWT